MRKTTSDLQREYAEKNGYKSWADAVRTIGFNKAHRLTKEMQVKRYGK